MEVKKVNINDIEDLILNKHEIETYLINSKKIEDKISLDEFISDYAGIDFILAENENNLIPFGIAKYNNIIYIFIINDNDKDIKLIMNKLTEINYDLNNLIEIGPEDLTKYPINSYIIVNGKYYK